MIGSMLVGTIIGVGFFTYKPLFSVLKKNKFSFKAAYNDYKENQETKEAFKIFATTQMDKIKRLIDSISKKAQKQNNQINDKEVIYKQETQGQDIEEMQPKQEQVKENTQEITPQEQKQENKG